jgi:cellulose synthase/poly-beta-1,6-N-acetylglucosamine synthase-like glycosyltransferase
VLEEVGGWDPYNVTEDADLGLRLARAGYRVGLISSPTFEEAPVRVRQWVHQRSRWIKGFIQTLGVFLREPCKGISEIGLIRWCSAVCLLGGAVLSSVVHGLLVIWLLMLALVPGWTLPGEAVVLLLSGFSVHILVSFLSMGQITFARLCGVMTAPLYWPLQTLAALKAIRELFTAPYFWDKTEHGVTRHQFDGSRLQG